jgi:phosphopantetheinyl transferase
MSCWIWSEPSEPYEPGTLLVRVVRAEPDCVVGAELDTMAEHPASWLSSRETARLRAIGTPEHRREWLSGRLTAKHAVWLTASRVRPRPAPRQIEIVADVWGRPRAYLWRRGRLSATGEISIAHCPGAVACATSGLGGPTADVAIIGQDVVGVDVELAAASILELIDRFTRPEERRCLARSPLPEVTATILWGLKEAAVKCLGGRVSRRRAFEVRLDEERSSARIMLHEAAQAAGGPGPLTGGFGTVGQHVVTWASSLDRPARLSVVQG